MSRLLITAMLAALLLLAGCSHSDDKVAVPSLKNRYRVIAVFAPDAARARTMTDAFKSAPGLEQRDIAWFVLGPKKTQSNIHSVPDRATLEKLHTVKGFQAVLLGKDGKLKASQLGGLDIQGLLDAIDPNPFSKQQLQQQQ